MLGLVILRGEEIVSLVLEGPPPAEEQQPLNAKNAAAGSGLAKAVGRGMAMPGGPAAGLAGPARGVGGPAPGMMLPRAQVCHGFCRDLTLPCLLFSRSVVSRLCWPRARRAPALLL